MIVTTFETIVDESRKLKLEAIEELIDILKAAAREKRRRAIAARGRRAVATPEPANAEKASTTS